MSYDKYPVIVIKSTHDKLDILLTIIDNKDIVVIDNEYLINAINYEIVLNMLRNNKLNIKNTEKIKLYLEDFCRDIDNEKLTIRFFNTITMEYIDELTYDLSKRVISEISKLVRKRVSKEIEDYVFDNVIFPLLIWCDSSEKEYAKSMYMLIHTKYMRLVDKMFFKQ